MQSAVTAPVELRWIKRIKEHQKMMRSVRQFMSYRLGLQFLNMNQELETLSECLSNRLHSRLSRTFYVASKNCI